ncbi:MAG TPA: hypothetical protein V6C96_01760, partial [Vampirovibrionales bacterium]
QARVLRRTISNTKYSRTERKEAESNFYKANSLNNIKKISPETKQEFIFLGCPGNEKSFEEVAKTLTSAQKAWNDHDLDGLAQHYATGFVTKDGLDLNKIKRNLSTFWFEYTDASIKSFPSTVQVCGDTATINLSELTTAIGQVENARVLPFPPKFWGWVQGITTLKKIGETWKITSENIIYEQMWKYYGNEVEKLLLEGRLALTSPENIIENQNYIAQLEYTLPSNVRGYAILDKILLSEFSEGENVSNTSDSKTDSIKRPISSGNDETPRTLRRLFTSNDLGQDELVRAQIELFTSDRKLLGLVGLSKRVSPQTKAIREEDGTLTMEKSFKEEALSKS